MKFDKNFLRLYTVTDRAWLRGRTLTQQAEAALRGGATCLQLREKDLDGAHFLEEARELRALCSRYGVPFLVNDNAEIARLSGADGVHVGQRDRPAAEVRRELGTGMLLGVSAQTAEQALQAERDGADYLGVGAVFPTGTKRDAFDVSIETLREICRAVKIPVCAIGGITPDNMAKLSGTGIGGVALVSAIFAAPDIESASRELRSLSDRLFCEEWEEKHS